MAASWCKKFQANIFNKSKCQNCFRSKEQHSAEALESAKGLRKVSKCGYLFVAPESFDFTNPMDKTRRWQRRFFILYDDGELTYSVDENVGTVPQGVIDMNKCSDVHDAETITTHQLSIAVKTPNATTFIKGCDKHEIARWFDVLVMYPRSIKTKHRRTPTFPTAITKPLTDTLIQPVTSTSATPVSSVAMPTTSVSSGFSSSLTSGTVSGTPRRHTYHASGWSTEDETQRDSDQDHLISTSTTDFHSEVNNAKMDVAYTADLDSDQGSGSLRRSGSDPRITDVTKAAVAESTPMTYRSVRSMKHKDRAYQEGMRKSNSMQDLSRPEVDPPAAPKESLYRSRSRENLYGSFPKRRSVSDAFDVGPDDGQTHLSESHSPTSSVTGDLKPKSFFQTLHESLLNPEPPKPKPKNSRYLRLASIPVTRAIDDYVGSVGEDEELSPRRSKSLDRPVNRRRESSPSPVSTTRSPMTPRSASSPRAKPSSTNSSDKSSYTNTTSSLSRSREWSSGLVGPNSHQPSSPALSVRSRSTDSITNSRTSRSPASSPSTTRAGAAQSGTNVSLLARQWSGDKRGTSDSSASMHGRNSRSEYRQTPRAGLKSACGNPSRSNQNVSTSAARVSHHAGVVGSPVTGPSGRGLSKFEIRMPPPYRTATLSTSPTYAFPRTPFIGQDPPSRPSSRSLSAPSPSRSKTSTESTRPSARSVERGRDRAEVGAYTPAPTTATSTESTRPSSRSVERGRDRAEVGAYTPAPTTATSTSYFLNGRSKNETDEHKMAKSGGDLAARLNQHLATHTNNKTQHQDPYDDLMYMKKGWLLKQDDQDWTKHWFVLSGTSLKFYQDSRAEEAVQLDGCMDISDCYEVIETDVTRNYGFKLKTSTGDHVLSAMTSGIRNNWMQAIQKCMETSARPAHRDFNSSVYASPTRAGSQRSTDYSTPQRQNSAPAAVESSRRLHQSAPPSASRVLYPAELGAHSPRSDSKSESGGSRMSTPDSWSRPSRGQRSLTETFGTMDGNMKSPSCSPQRGRFVSCTWPYDSSSSSGTSSERDHTPDSHGSRSRRSSNVSQYLEDEDAERRERSQEEEHELDHVEHNIRRIHRRSISDSVHKHKPQHFDKFESGAAFDEKDPEQWSRRLESPSRSQDRGTAPSTSQPKEAPPHGMASGTCRRTATPERKVQTTSRAPSAKIKEKSRAKSPRPRSPPPLEAKTREITVDRRPSDEEVLKEITDGRWKDDNEGGEGMSLRPEGLTSVTDTSVTGQEQALVELLETEVESLKTQLERTRSELSESHQQNLNLKAQLRSSRRDHHELISDLETDQTRYLTQIEDIQDQMEHTTEYLQTKLTEQQAQLKEQESHSELTKLQVQTLKKQLKEAKDTTEAQEADINSLREQLENAESEDVRLELMAEKEQLVKLIDDLEAKVKVLEEEIERLETDLHHKNKVLEEKEKSLIVLQDAIDQGEQTVMDMERDLEELASLRSKVKDGVEKMADLEEELSALRNQLTEQDQELQAKDDVHRAQLFDVEQRMKNGKEKLESHIDELEKQLDLTRRQSTMSDSLNSNMADILREKDETIAQLEEKLIENDTKIEELTEELAMEIDENTQLQQNLVTEYNSSTRIKRDLDQASKDITQLEEALERATGELADLRTSENSQREEAEILRRDVSKYQTEVEVLKHENQELREAVEDLRKDASKADTEDLKHQLDQHRQENEAFRRECTVLEEELTKANQKVVGLEAQLADQKQQLEQDLQGRHQELIDARRMATELQAQLQATRESVAENQKMIEANMEAVQPFKGTSVKPLSASGRRSDEDVEDIRTKYERSVQEVKRLRGEVREAHISIDDMEIASASLKQQFRAMELDYQQQLALMSTRVQDLTAKLAAADKKVRKLERRAARRESKLKLRRDSLESTEKNAETDSQTPDLNVMDLLKGVANAQSTDVSVEDSGNLNVSASSTNSKPEEDAPTPDTSDSDLLSLADPEVAAKFTKLRTELEASQQKVKTLMQELEGTDTKDLDEVKKQNKEYEEQIIFLTATLNTTGASAAVAQAKAKRSVSQDREEEVMPAAVGSDLSGPALADCRHRLAAVVEDLRSVDETSTDRYATIIESLRVRLEKILKDTKGDSQPSPGVCPEKQISTRSEDLGADKCLHLFAEKLSLEAVLVGEMARIIRADQDHMMSEREVYLHEVAEANHRILELEQRVQGSDTKGVTSGRGTSDSVAASTTLLAEKMLLEGQVRGLLHKYEQQEKISPGQEMREGESTATGMVQQALLKGRLSEKLRHSCVQSPSLASQALVQGELTFILNKLRERMADSRTDQERIDLLDHELEVSHQRLCERANLMCDSVEAYKIAALDRVAASVLNNKATKNQIDSQIATLIKNSASAYRKLSVDGEHLGVMAESIPESRRHSMIEASIEQEIEETVEVLAERCQLESPESVRAESEEGVTAVLEAVCEVLAQKAVIDGHIAYITEQIQQHQQQAPPSGQPLPAPLRRHDSGIMIHGTSLPTSPTAGTDGPDCSSGGEQTTLASRLAHDARTKRDLAVQFLTQKPDDRLTGIHSQMAKIAADLVNVDVNMIRHRRMITDYAEVIAQEAMFQAQMSYLVTKLKLEHERELSSVQQQIHTQPTSDTMADHVAELEKEIQRLSCLLSENDELLKMEAAAAQQRLAGLEEELQRQEDHFQQEVQGLEDRYRNRLKGTDRDLMETREELEKVQLEKQKELREHEKVITSLEEELRETRSHLNRLRGANVGGTEGMESEVLRLENDIKLKQDELKTLREDHESEVTQHKARIAALEDDIQTLRSNHQRELRQAQEDMKTAMKAVSVQGATKLEEEVQSLRVDLEEERRRHVAELEKLRLELSEDADTASQAILTSKIHHLQMQMDNIQADYEQELAIQRSAHRRELTRSKDDLLTLLSQAEAKSMQVDEGTIRKRYTKEMERIKEIYDRGFAAMEKSHQRVLREMRQAHKRELELLRSEKDQLLVEETKATQAALDAMRKAHEAEVQKERNKFLDAISKTYSHSDVDALQRQHEDDLDLIQNEIRQLSEQYSIKCLEASSLEERLDMQTKALADSRKRVHDLIARNEELHLQLRQDIERLNKLVQPKDIAADPSNPEEGAGAQNFKVALRVKAVETQQMRDEIEALKTQLQGTTEELEDSMEKYQELHSEAQAKESLYEKQIHRLRSRLEEVMMKDRDCDDSESVTSEAAPSEGAVSERSTGGSPDPEDEGSDTPTPRDPSTDGDDEDIVHRSTSSGLPNTMTTDSRTTKRMLWRQRQPRRAYSSPGPPSLLRRLSLPVEQTGPARLLLLPTPSVPAPSRPEDGPAGHTASTISAGDAKRERAGRHTIVGVNVAPQVFNDKF